ncbi:MAG: PH domain-containing protein [Pseudomonadota bacterium]
MDRSATNPEALPDRSWRRVSALSLVFFVADLAKTIARNFVQIIVPTIAFLASTGGFSKDRLSLLGAAAIGVILVYAVAMFLNTRFQLGSSGIVLRTGVFSRKQLNLEYRRIQALNLSQNPIYRWFGVYDLTLDSAGSSDTELILPAVREDVVAELRALLDTVESPISEFTPPSSDQVLSQLNALDMVRIGISSQRSLVFLAVLGSAFGALETQGWTERALDSVMPTQLWDATDASLFDLIVFALVGVTIVLALIILLSIASSFWRFNRFRLEDRQTEYVSTAGLFTVRTQTLPLRKAQVISVVRGLVHRWLDRSELAVHQAAGRDFSAKGEFVIPLVGDAQLGRIVGGVLDVNATGFLRRQGNGAFLPISWRYWLSRWRIYGWLPALSAGLSIALNDGVSRWLWLIVPVWLVLSAAIFWQRHRRWGYFVFDQGIALRQGFLGERIDVFLWRKMQFVALKETPFLARHGLCHLHVATAAGQRRLPFVPRELAVRLADRALVATESSKQSWI